MLGVKHGWRFKPQRVVGIVVGHVEVKLAFIGVKAVSLAPSRVGHAGK